MLRSLAAILLLAIPVSGAEPIAGQWLLKSQTVNGRETATNPLTLRITQMGDSLEFEYSVKTAQKQEVSLRFAARLDGSPAEVANSSGRKIGTAKVTRAGAGYQVMLEGAGRPTSNGVLTLSKDGKALTSVSDASAPGNVKLHTVQVFERK